MPGPNIGKLAGIYDPAQISVWVAGSLITGFGEEFIRITPRENEYYDDVGVDGEICRWPSNNYFADIVLSLLPTASSNAALQALQLVDRLSGSNFFSVIIKDVSGINLTANILTDSYLFPVCWIKSSPVIVYRKGVELREWPIVGALYYPIILGTGQLL